MFTSFFLIELHYLANVFVCVHLPMVNASNDVEQVIYVECCSCCYNGVAALMETVIDSTRNSNQIVMNRLSYYTTNCYYNYDVLDVSLVPVTSIASMDRSTRRRDQLVQLVER